MDGIQLRGSSSSRGVRLWMFGALVSLIMTIILVSCYEEKFTTDPGDKVVFSTDTLSFDTVLTAVSTVTRIFKIYNPHDLFIRLDEIKIKGPAAVFFRLNVDGSTGEIIRDVEINPNDSIYVFVEATIDPDQPESVSPFILEAAVSCMVNQQEQNVTLIAWGQNANYIPGPNTPNRILILTCDLGEVTWDDPKPYVLYGTLLIDSCKLILPPGARLYVHGGIANNELGIYNEGLIYTLPHGQLDVAGTADRPVIIRDDRIEPDYDGAWAGIRLGPESGPHAFRHMELANGLIGIYADSASSVTIDHSRLAFTAGPAFYARHAQAQLSNSLFYENGSQAIALTYGGNYDISYCTMANFGNTTEALLLNNFYCSDPLCAEGIFINKLIASVQNCIVIGSSSDELWINDAAQGQGMLDVQMNNNIVIVDQLLLPNLFPDFFTAICTDCFEYKAGDTLFLDMPHEDFHLDTLSIAEMKGKPVPGIPDDMDGTVRDLLLPDIGCYEFK